MLGIVVCCIALAISAVYGLISGGRHWRWARAPTSSRHPGRPVVTPVDMFCALLGAIAGQWLFGGWQGEQLRRLKSKALLR